MFRQKNISQRGKEKARKQIFQGINFPIFLKVSSFILVFGMLPFSILVIWIVFTYNSIIDKFMKTIGISSYRQEIFSLLELMKKDIQTIKLQIGIAFFILLVLVFFGLLFISRSITKPVSRLVKGINRIREGDYDIVIPSSSRDEIGLLIREFNLMVEQLKEIKKREKAFLVAKAELITITAHQFRTPLSVMKWALETIREDGMKNFTDQQKNLLEKTYAANERMIKLISDMLDAAKIEEGRFGFIRKNIDLQAVLREVVNSFQDLARQKEINLHFLSSSAFPIIVAVDPERFNLVLRSILENAIIYTMADGIVTVSLKEEQDQAEIIIHDSGVGIPKQELNKLFTKFFRGSNIIKLGIMGSGLGLVIAKNIIEAFGGKIKIESEEGKGTTVYLSLPLVKK